jgi:CRISPR/Cas system-associated exonuclease Cas4 (RecB family)
MTDSWHYSYYNILKKAKVSWSRVSPSQIDNYKKCPRSWYFKSILKVREEQRGAQALGTSFHLIMEKVPKGLTWPSREDTNASPEEWAKAEQMAKIALPLLPEDPSQLSRRECGISLETYPNGPQMIGYVDLAIPAGVGWPAFLIPKTEKIIVDYKTLSDFRYMKTPEELADNVQMMTYAKWALEDLNSNPKDELGLTSIDPVASVRLLHVYAKTRPPFSRSSIRESSAIVTPEQINTYWNKTLDTVREMEQVATYGSFEDVKAEGALNGHCEAYGGCSFRDKCGISKESGIKGLFQIKKKPENTETPDMSGSPIMAKIIAARAAQAAAASGQTVAANVQAQSQSTSQEVPGSTVKPDVTPVSQSQPVTIPTGQAEVVKPTGPISGMIEKIKTANNGDKPTLAGGVAQAYAKEQGFTTAGAILGTGKLAGNTISTVGDLVKLASASGVASGVLSSDAPSREQPIITQPGQAVEEPETVMAGGVVEEETEEEETPNAVVTGTTTITHIEVKDPDKFVADVAAEVTKRRGRPTKEEMAQRVASEKTTFDALVDAEVQKRLAGGAVVQEATKLANSAGNTHIFEPLQNEIADLKGKLAAALANQTPVVAAPQDQGCTLYVDCFPVKGQREGLVDYFEWIQPVAAAVAEANGVKDWRLIQYTAKGLLANAIREMVKAEGLPTAMTLQTYAAGADIVLEVLTPLAKRIIKKL